MKIILFDIDGTLLRTGGAGALAFNRAFKELFEIENAWNGYNPGGKTDFQIIAELSLAALGRSVTRIENEEIASRYVQYHEEFLPHAPNFRLMKGVLELLGELSERGFLLGLATGNFKETADQKLRHGKIDHFFSFGGYGSDAYERLELTRLAAQRGIAKYGTAHKEIILIGDARQDVECGKALGFRTIGVSTGALSYEELTALKPDLVLKDLMDTEKILRFVADSV